MDSAIVANSAKNKRKAEKKRKALEKRNSESESELSIVDDKQLKTPEIKLDETPEGSFEDSSNDSGLASSLEESVNLNFDGVKFSDDEDNNPLQMFHEYIFNIDF